MEIINYYQLLIIKAETICLLINTKSKEVKKISEQSFDVIKNLEKLRQEIKTLS